MVIVTGKVRHGTVEVEAGELPEGAVVTVLAPEGDETFVLGAADEDKLVAAIHEAERGAVVPVSETLAAIRRS